MFRIMIGSFEDGFYHDTLARYETEEDALEATEHMFVKLYPLGDYARLEDFKIERVE